MDGRTTDNGPWHKLAGLRPVELKTNKVSIRHHTENLEIDWNGGMEIYTLSRSNTTQAK